MSQEKVLKTLETLGLTKFDAQVYIFLGKRGPQKAKDISKSLKVPKQTLYRTIKSLQSKGILTATLEHPAKFVAVPFERVLDLFVKAKTEEVHQIKEDKKALLSDWQKIALAEVGDLSPRFTVIQGRNFIYPKLKQMTEETKSQLSMISTVSGLLRADQSGLLDVAFSHVLKTNIRFKLITEISKENLKTIKMVFKVAPKGSSFESRTPELGLKLISRMLIKDDAEAAFFVSQDEDKTAEEIEDMILWTNSTVIVNSFRTVFDDLWQNSTDIEKRITEIETEKLPSRTYVIKDEQTAKKNYDEAISSAKSEIVMMTSSIGLTEAFKNIVQLKSCIARGVAIKIMAPITRNSLKVALQLSECCKIRHVPTSYLRTTIIDNAVLFQFKNPPTNREKQYKTLSFRDTFFTSDSDYVEKVRAMLDDVWKNSTAPSTLTVEEIAKPATPLIAPVPENEYTISRKDSAYQRSIISSDEKPGVITEQDVLSKMINAKRAPVRSLLKDIVRLYGCNASAVIHSPRYLNLPDMFLLLFHLNKKSTFGAEDSLQVQLRLETPKGHAFVPVAFVGDNPTTRSTEWRKMILSGTPAAKNINLLGRDELQIQLHGNTLFAGWTVPIPLFPPNLVLPPASLLIEGYGKTKTAVIKSTTPSGAKILTEGNGLDAFVTFFHPESKYAGPGTDGTLGREMIMTVYPPPFAS